MTKIKGSNLLGQKRAQLLLCQSYIYVKCTAIEPDSLQLETGVWPSKLCMTSKYSYKMNIFF